MSGANAAFRIVKMQAVVFEGEEDDSSEIISRRDRNSWSPKIAAGVYDTIKPSFSSPMEIKSTRRRAMSPPYPEYLAKFCFAGAFILAIGIMIVVTYFNLQNKEIELVGWAITIAGASISALSLVRAQDLIRRQK